MNTITKKLPILQLLPVFFCFGIMAFVDISSAVSSIVKEDFGLNDKMANLLPSMALIWFLVISLPTSALMDRIGRKSTVIISLSIMTAAMLIPLFSYSFPMILLSFAVMGIGNTILQVSLNPLLKNVVSGDMMTSSITFGQFVKAVVSLLGPYLVGVAVAKYGNWTMLFWIYAPLTMLACLWLVLTPIEREKTDSVGRRSSAAKIFALLKDRYLLVCFSIIVLIVGYEICLVTVIPKYLLECCGMPLSNGLLAITLFYGAKTAAAFVGAFILARIAPVKYQIWSMVAAVAACAWLMTIDSKWSIIVAIAVLGLATANVFAIVLSLAMQHRPEFANEISALMITGIAGGAVLPPVMGAIADAYNQQVSLVIPLVALIYILFASVKWLKKR